MRQALLAAPHEIAVVDGPAPTAAPGELLVRPEAVGICGSDLHALDGRHPFIELPVVPGHEAAGVVEALGEGATGFAVGDRVLLEPNLVCGHCLYCAELDRYNLCEHLEVVGCQTAGAMAELFTAPARRFHRVPEGMSAAAAALVEPLSTGTHAARVAGDLRGASVAVLGAGSIGILTMLAARAAGAEAVAVTDPVAAKRERAGRLGADLTVDPAEAGAVDAIRAGLPRRPDVVFDCVAVQATTDQGIALALKGGTVVVVGVPTDAVTLPLPLVQDRELRLQGTAMYVREDVERALALIESGTVAADELVSGDFGLESAPEAFAAARSGEHVKVQVTMG